MAKLVIGSNKQNGVPTIVKEVVVQPSLGTKNITANGTYNASSDNYDGYSSVTVNVPTVSEPYLELYIDNGYRIHHSRLTSRLVQLSGFKYLDDYIFYYAYMDNHAITGDANFSDLTTIDRTAPCFGMFYNSYITSISCPALKTINTSGPRAFSYVAYNSKLTTFSFPVLERITGLNVFDTAFAKCSGLTSGNFPALNVLTGNLCFHRAFEDCTNLTSLSFPALTSTSFGSVTNQFLDMLSGVTGCTVHFPSNLQSVIGSWSDVQNGFGGTNTTVLFDLPQTE